MSNLKICLDYLVKGYEVRYALKKATHLDCCQNYKGGSKLTYMFLFLSSTEPLTLLWK